jgi:hypothetical protein
MSERHQDTPYRAPDALGTLVSEHKVAPLEAYRYFRIAAVFAAIGTTLGALAHVVPIAWFMLAAALSLAGMLHLGVHRARHQSLRLFLHEGGLVLAQEGARHAYLWDSFSTVHATWRASAPRSAWAVWWQFQIFSRALVYELESEDRSRFVLHRGYRDYASLEKSVLAAIRPRIRARLEERLKRGDVVTLGELSMSEEGLSVTGRTIGWADLRRVRLEKDLLVVESTKSRRWGVAHVKKIPNAGTAIAMANARVSKPVPA